MKALSENSAVNQHPAEELTLFLKETDRQLNAPHSVIIIGGAAALMAKAVKTAEVVAYEDLGPEAIRRLEVENFPVVVVNDCHGGDLYKEGMKKYQK